MNHPLNYYKNGLKMLILASDRYFQIRRTITIYLALAMKSCSTHIHNGSPLGRGSKIKLIISAEFSAKGYPPPSPHSMCLKLGTCCAGFPIEGGGTQYYGGHPPPCEVSPPPPCTLSPPLRKFFPLRGLFTCLQ